jgi:hypothetical protein
MKVLVACEFSGIVREQFRLRGHDAWSCDLLPTEIPGNHYHGNVLDILNDWSIIGGKADIMIGHPVCTRRANSGVRWLKNNPLRMNQLRQDDIFFNTLWYADVDKICLENPIPHRYTSVVDYTQIIQPWQFGHGETKATCLWLKGLPKLIPTNIVEGREARIHKMPPSDHRAKDRSRTYQGIATAMSLQWNF